MRHCPTLRGSADKRGRALAEATEDASQRPGLAAFEAWPLTEKKAFLREAAKILKREDGIDAFGAISASTCDGEIEFEGLKENQDICVKRGLDILNGFKDALVKEASAFFADPARAGLEMEHLDHFRRVEDSFPESCQLIRKDALAARRPEAGAGVREFEQLHRLMPRAEGLMRDINYMSMRPDEDNDPSSASQTGPQDEEDEEGDDLRYGPCEDDEDFSPYEEDDDSSPYEEDDDFSPYEEDEDEEDEDDDVHFYRSYRYYDQYYHGLWP